jgi:TRAP-type mannitol/chloroaromatic compound transport system permease large subunit
MFGRWWSPPFFFSLFFFSKNTSEEVYTANIFWALRFHVRPDLNL